MKPFLQFSLKAMILVCFLTNYSTAQITYVNSDASGSNDGSSWADAFTDLHDALPNGNEVWIAKGTYYTSDDPQDTSQAFTINKGIKLLGGFAGTENTADERDPISNPTILSGDLAKNYDPSNPFDHIEDNAIHVIVVDSLISAPVIFDGLHITGGVTSDDFNLPSDNLYRGGGVIAYSPVNVNACQFYGNFAGSGAGIYLSSFGGGAHNSTFTNTSFNNNRTTGQSAGIYALHINGLTIDQCEFKDNTVNRGAVYPQNSENISITNSRFENNTTIATTNFGGAIFNWQSSNIMVQNCEFINNTAGNAGCIYSNAEQLPRGTNVLMVDNCSFRDNEALDWGGGTIYSWQAQLTIQNSSFVGNVAANSGGAFFCNTDSSEVYFTNNSFSNNRATFGGTHSCYGHSNYYISNSSYTKGFAGTSGGGIIVGFLANVEIDGTIFEENIANFGGAISVQNDTTAVEITNCEFNLNNAESNAGGAINLGTGTSGKISYSQFLGNLSDIGGAITSSANQIPLEINACSFSNNIANSQGGAINVFDNEVIATNSIFYSNINNGIAGGAISNNSADSSSSSVTLINNTFYDNFASIGSSVSQFSGENESSATLTLQNNLLLDEIDAYGVEDGMGTVLSNGGNISYHESFSPYLTEANDYKEYTDDVVVDPFDEDFNLLNNSVAVDNGTALNAPTTDFNGHMRDGTPDSGALELNSTNIQDAIKYNLSVFPNPAQEFTTIEMDNSWKGLTTINILDNSGRTIYTQEVSKNTDHLSLNISLDQMTTGIYYVEIQNQSKIVSLPLIKL